MLTKVLTSKKIMSALGVTVGGLAGFSSGVEDFKNNIIDYGVLRHHTYKGKVVYIEDVQPKTSDITTPTVAGSAVGLFSGYATAKVLPKVLSSVTTFIRNLK